MLFVNVSELPLVSKTLTATGSAADVADVRIDFSPYMKRVLGIIWCQAYTTYGSSRTMCEVAVSGATQGKCSFVSLGEVYTVHMTAIGIPK